MKTYKIKKADDFGAFETNVANIDYAKSEAVTQEAWSNIYAIERQLPNFKRAVLVYSKQDDKKTFNGLRLSIASLSNYCASVAKKLKDIVK